MTTKPKPKPQANRTKPNPQLYYLTDADLATLDEGWRLAGYRSKQEFVSDAVLSKARRVIAKRLTE